ncbi:MAG: hypothetical protein GY797_08055, partial [Deltaproteobacteria bacterium]|nr:hypothetical protein [Deltaproteobacteria bacterium]
TQIPHAIITFFCVYFFYLIGKKVHSEKFGYLCAVMFVLIPWLPITARRVEVFILFSTLFELAAFYFYLGYVQEPGRKLYKIAAPVSIALYLTGAMDWPSFFVVLFIFLVLNKTLRQALKNPYNIFPGVVLLGYFLFSAAAYWIGEAPWRLPAMFSSPFQKVFSNSASLATTPLSSMLRFVHKAFGPGGLLAVVGVFLFVFSKKLLLSRQEFRTAVHKKFFMTMSVWLIVFSLPLLKFAASLTLETNLRGFLTYSYVIGIPMTIFSALLLVKDKRGFFIAGVVCLMVWNQWHVIITNEQTFTFKNPDRRVLAVTAFLIEQRPDLLGKDKIAFLAGEQARSIGQYARGQNMVLSLFADYPKYLAKKFRENPGKSIEGFAEDMILSYTVQRKLKVDWLILTPEL